MTIVEGSVPSIPPLFVPYFSATMVMIMTMSAEKKKGRIVWKRRVFMEQGILLIHKIFVLILVVWMVFERYRKI